MARTKKTAHTIATGIYQSLAEDIAKGVLVPGQKLEEKIIAEQFGVSRTPVREALRELAARGLVEMHPHRGGMVAKIDVEQIADMLEAECEIEATCARLAAQRMTPLEREQLYSLHEDFARHVEAGRIDDALTSNRLFHDQICRGGHNKTIAALALDLRLRLSPFRKRQRGSDAERLRQSLAEHDAIVDAIRAADPVAAYQAMTVHSSRLSAGAIRRLSSEQLETV